MIFFFKKNYWTGIFFLLFAFIGIFVFNLTSVSGTEYVEFEEDTPFSLESWGESRPDYYIAAGSKAESVEFVGDTLNVVGIPAGFPFVLKTDTHTILSITALSSTDLTLQGEDVLFDGYVTGFTMNTADDVDYVFSTPKINTSYGVTLNGVAITGSPFDSGENGSVSFTNSGTGVFVVDIPVYVEFENDTEFILDGMSETQTYYIGAGSMAISVEYIGNTMNVVGIPTGEDFILKTDEHTILSYTSTGEDTNLTFYGEDITTSGHITKFTTSTGHNTSYVVGTYLANAAYEVVYPSGASGVIFSTSGKQISFVSDESGEFTILGFDGVIFEEDTVLELDGLNTELDFYITENSMANKVEYLDPGKIINIEEITGGGHFGIKVEQSGIFKNHVIKIEPSIGADVIISSDNISQDGYISQWDIVNSGDTTITVGVGKADTDYTISVDGVAVAGSNSGVSSEITFTLSTSGTYTITEGSFSEDPVSIVRTEPAIKTRSVDGESAVLMGNLLSVEGFSEVNVWFEWGKDEELLVNVHETADQLMAGTGKFSQEVSFAGAGYIVPQFGERYYFRALARGDAEELSGTGEIRSFIVTESLGMIKIKYGEDKLKEIDITGEGVIERVK